MHLGDRLAVKRLIFYHSALPHLPASDFELRLHQHQQMSARPEQRRKLRRNQRR